MKGGRPLRFLLLVVGGWSGGRVWWLWPEGPVPAVATRTAAAPDKIVVQPPLAAALPATRTIRVAFATRLPVEPTTRAPSSPTVIAAVRRGPMGRSITLAAATTPGFDDPVLRLDPTAAYVPPRRSGSRLSGSAWLLARGGPALGGGLAGAQLGGSQAGVRLAYTIDHARRLAIVGRLSTALGASGSSRFLSDREGAVGVAWRPTRLAVTLVAEQRFVFDGGHGGPTVGVIAGLSPTPVAAGFRLEAYGQAGAIARSGPAGGLEAFGDGAARLTRPVTLGRVKLDLGAGAWSGAQRGAARLDIGPTIGASLPIAGHGVRLTADWRKRIAGAARPGSGPALSLGTDF